MMTYLLDLLISKKLLTLFVMKGSIIDFYSGAKHTNWLNKCIWKIDVLSKLETNKLISSLREEVFVRAVIKVQPYLISI